MHVYIVHPISVLIECACVCVSPIHRLYSYLSHNSINRLEGFAPEELQTEADHHNTDHHTHTKTRFPLVELYLPSQSPCHEQLTISPSFTISLLSLQAISSTLKTLDLSHNTLIDTTFTTLSVLRSLEILLASHIHILHIITITNTIAPMHSLQRLDLSYTPVSACRRYRESIIQESGPALKYLDDKEIRAQEREFLQRLDSRRRSLSNRSGSGGGSVVGSGGSSRSGSGGGGEGGGGIGLRGSVGGLNAQRSSISMLGNSGVVGKATGHSRHTSQVQSAFGVLK